MNIKILVIFVKNKIEKNDMKDKKYHKVTNHCHYTWEYRDSVHSIYNLKYSTPKNIPIVFHNGSNCAYHFVIKKLAAEFKKQFTCLRENTEKYITFTVPTEKEVTRIGKNGEEITKNVSYISQFIASTRFIVKSLSTLVNNLSEAINKLKCKFRHDDKKIETWVVKYQYCNCFLGDGNFKDDLIEYKSLCCNKNYHQKFDEKLEELFLNTYKNSNQCNNKFILLLWKRVYPYEYTDDWEKFNETSSSKQEDFYSNLNMEDNTDAEYAHTKRVCKNFKIKKIRKRSWFVCSKQYFIVSWCIWEF